MSNQQEKPGLSLTAWKLQLYEALASNRGLQHIVDVAFSLMNNPIFVTDANYNFIARKAQLPQGEESSYAQELARDLNQTRLGRDQIAYIQSWELEVHSFRSDGSCIFYNEGFGCRAMFSSIRIRGSIVAQMMMLESVPFTQEMQELFVFLASVLSQEVQKNSFKISLEYQESSGFLFNLLNTSRPSAEIMQNQVQKRHMLLKDRFRIAVARSQDGMLKSLQASSISQQFQRLLPDSMYTLYEDALVFLLEFDTGRTLTKEMKENLRQKAWLNSLILGVSNEFTDLTEIHLFYRQAKQAINLAPRSRNTRIVGNSLLLYEDLACLDLLSTASSHLEVRRLCHPYLMTLLAYDRENHTALTQSLYIFLQKGRSLRAAAEALYIHKNTMSYRLGKIRDLLEDDLTDEETLFLLELSFHILIFLDLFVPPQTGPS